MTTEYNETAKSIHPPHVGNSFSFKFEDQRGRVHRFNCGTETLDELVSVVMKRIGLDGNSGKLQLLYEDDEGDKVLLTSDNDVVGAVNHARSAGWKVLKLHIDHLETALETKVPSYEGVLSRLKQFSAMNKLKQMALLVIAESLSEEEICGLKELFRKIDTDNSGTITFDKLKEGLRKVGSELMESEIKSLMDAADIDQSGTIGYGEFLAATVHMNKLEREENLISAFSFFDKDGSGYITVDELSEACKQFGLHDAHLDEMIKEIDQDNDGQIDYGEFAAMMRKGNGALEGGP